MLNKKNYIMFIFSDYDDDFVVRKTVNNNVNLPNMKFTCGSVVMILCGICLCGAGLIRAVNRGFDESLKVNTNKSKGKRR